MPTVQKLPEDIIRRIAAGEVVERPASVLKELLENALDAGARRITIEWTEAGRKSLRVTDDGHGMSPQDARLALERHATSKILSLNDLDDIRTFGFRGEALPSIGAVSRFQLTTRRAEDAEAWALTCEGGRVLREGPAGAPTGTTVCVEDIFFNTPAREKFLKSDATERGQLWRVAEDVALGASHIEFRVVSEGKEALSLRPAKEGLPALDALRDRVAALWRLESKGLKPLLHEGRFARISGWISDIHAHQASGRYQRFFVNQRPVSNKRLTRALYDAYHAALPVGRHPAAVLFFQMDPAFVDVNVHPSKREVRFSHENELYGFFTSALKTALSGSASMPAAPHHPERPQVSSQTVQASLYLQSPAPAGWVAESHDPLNWVKAGSVEKEGPLPPPELFADPAASQAMGVDLEVFRQAKPAVLAQMSATYILARLGDDFFIFDQHAAAERALYERLAEAAKNEAPHRQALLLPWVWELPAQAAAVVSGHLKDFTRLGFGLEPFGSQSLRVTAVPHSLGESFDLRGFLDGLAEDLTSGAIARHWESLLIRAACRGSIKAGDLLQVPEMERVIQNLQACQNPWSCPHGRPTFLRLSPEDLAKRFRRT